MLFYPPGLSVNILQVTPFTINSKPTDAWCLSDDLMYTCKLSQDPGVTKPNAGGEVVQECLCMLLEIPIFSISAGVTIPFGLLYGLKPKQQTWL